MTLAAHAPEGGFSRRARSLMVRRVLLAVIVASALVLSAFMVHAVGRDSGASTGSLAGAVVELPSAGAADEQNPSTAVCITECDPIVAFAMACWMLLILTFTIMAVRPAWFARSSPRAVHATVRAVSEEVRRFAPTLHSLSIDRQ